MAEASGSGSWESIPRPEGKDDQHEANHYGENPDKWRQGGQIGASQDREDRAEEHRQRAAAGKQPHVLYLAAQHDRCGYLEYASHNRPPRNNVEQPACGHFGPEEGYQAGDDTHRSFGQREPPSHAPVGGPERGHQNDTSVYQGVEDRKSTRLNSSHANISYAVFCLKKKKKKTHTTCSY